MQPGSPFSGVAAAMRIFMELPLHTAEISKRPLQIPNVTATVCSTFWRNGDVSPTRVTLTDIETPSSIVRDCGIMRGVDVFDGVYAATLGNPAGLKTLVRSIEYVVGVLTAGVHAGVDLVSEESTDDATRRLNMAALRGERENTGPVSVCRESTICGVEFLF
jgi:hypothetical protein